ncbi:hypothetical protein VE03_03405 [Neofusicoccum parvum]|nr:hypothetical protein VE03_03405 [Neofusicoccum parvum]
MTKIVAVTGATGTQGGSVANALLESGEWKVRAITRNPSGDAAKALAAKGAEVVRANFDDEASLVKAFEGAQAVFAVTNYWEHLFTGKSQSEAGEIEEEQAMLLAKAAAQTETVEHYVWSTLQAAKDLTNGKYPVPHLDYKARVDQRIRDELPELAAKTTFLFVGLYPSNLAYFPMLKFLEVPGSGKYIWTLPTKPSAKIPSTGDISVTPGIWVRQILANPQKSLGKYAGVATEVSTYEKMLQDWSEVTGKPAIFVEVSPETFEKLWGIPGREIAQQFQFGEHIDDWYANTEGRFVTQEELGIKPEEARGFKMAAFPNTHVLLIAVVSALGGFVYGVDSGIIATTMGHDSFKLYMYGPSMADASIQGAIVSLYNAGQSLGTVASSWSADRFSRRYTIMAAGLLATLGAALQTAAVHVGMMIAGRFVAGLACGMILATVPVYIAEISPHEHRGLMVGMQGMMIAVGFAAANWIGYGGAFAESGAAQWRIPLAMQVPGALALSLGCIGIPFSPRWLVQQERYAEARQVIERLHRGKSADLIDREFIQVRCQLALERSSGRVKGLAGLRLLVAPRYLRRTALAVFILAMSQLSGSSVIQNYQNVFYQMVGFTGRTSLLISGVYGMMGVVGQAVYLAVVADRWRRTTTLWVGSVVLSTLIAICMALSATYARFADAAAGARAAIAMIFIYSACYAVFFNAMVWVVPSEIFPFFLRATGVGLGVFAKAVVAIVLSQITPVAIEDAGWRYYSLFIATNMAAAVLYFFFLPETRGKTLEEIGELFGDALATDRIDRIDAVAKGHFVCLEEAGRDGARGAKG